MPSRGVAILGVYYGSKRFDTDVDVGLLFAVHTFKLLHVMLFISGATFLGEQALLLLIQISSMCTGRASQHCCSGMAE